MAKKQDVLSLQSVVKIPDDSNCIFQFVLACSGALRWLKADGIDLIKAVTITQEGLARLTLVDFQKLCDYGDEHTTAQFWMDHHMEFSKLPMTLWL